MISPIFPHFEILIKIVDKIYIILHEDITILQNP